MSDLSGKVILVTGAGSGIGRGIAQRAAQLEASVVVADIDAAAARETVEMLGARATALVVEVDVTNDDQVQEMVARSVETFGRLDAAVNNAGGGPPPTPLLELTPAQLDATLALNVKGTWQCLAHEARQMRSAGGGSIVNFASALGLRAQPGTGAYGASKAAVVHLTKVAARELAGDGIRVNVVCPGPTETPGFDALSDDPAAWRRQVVSHVPLGRMGQPVDVAEAVLWLCSDRASFVTGATLAVDGGESS